MNSITTGCCIAGGGPAGMMLGLGHRARDLTTLTVGAAPKVVSGMDPEMEGSGQTAREQVEPDRRLAQARPSEPFRPRQPRGTQFNAAARVNRSGPIRYGEHSERLWSSVSDATMKFVRGYRPDVGTLRTLLDPTALPMLSRRFGTDGSAVLGRIWSGARERWATLPRQSSFGATITVRLAAVTVAAYETFIAEGAGPEDATVTVYDVAWVVYQKMGSAAWALSAVAGKDDADRMRVTTVTFRTFPFSAPSYELEGRPEPGRCRRVRLP